MSNILNSNDYKRGYNDGYNDGFNDKDKNFIKSGMSLKFAVWGSVAIDTYNQGYHAGYEKGCYDRLSKDKPQKVVIENQQTNTNNQSFNNNNLNFTSMSTIQQYALQREKLIELTQFLNQFKEDVNQKLSEYKQRVQYMYETGLPEETYNRFEVEHIAETEQLVNAITQLIEDRSIPFAGQNIELMENLINLNG
jgi:hypothetical protein